MNYVSLCDGIGAVHVAWQPLGWRCLWTSEIEAFPIAVVEHHWKLPNLGDMTKIDGKKAVEQYGQPDLVCGGTPCQSFSVAGLRKGMADPRGNLALVFLRLVDTLRPRWVVWENVPGVLSSGQGRDFGSFLGALGQFGYGFAYRVLDAQFFGVPQRRRRVFVVGCLGDWRRAAAVLFERESLSGNPAPSREAGKGVAGTLENRARGGGFPGTDEACNGYVQPVVGAITASYGTGAEKHPERVGRECSTLVMAHGQASAEVVRDGLPSLTCNHEAPIAAFDTYNQTLNQTLRKGDKEDQIGAIWHGSQVRRLTPLECERLQGFPDGYTAIEYKGKPAADGPRYRALGNSMAVPVMQWIGRRIDQWGQP